jgi:hypothetical protein
MLEHADYALVEFDEKYLLVMDTGHDKGHCSVTSDADYVVKDLHNRYGLNLGGRRLFYIDSEKSIDEICFRRGCFIGFKRGHEGVVFKTELAEDKNGEV